MSTIKKIDINDLKISTNSNNNIFIDTKATNLIGKVNQESTFTKAESINIGNETNNYNIDLCSAKDFGIDKVLPKIAAENYQEPDIKEKIEDIISRIVNIFGLNTEEMKIYKQFLEQYQVLIPIEVIKNVNKIGDSMYIYLENGAVIGINSSGVIHYISTEDASYLFYDDGSIRYICFENGNYKGVSLSFDKDGNIIGGSFEDENGNTVPIDIFGEYNVNAGQYGGAQQAFRDKVEEMLQDPQIIARLKEYFPNATMEDYECYLLKICNVGCGYTAIINSLFEQYEGREKEFLEKFGFPMYDIKEDGTIDYNYEYLILEYFNYAWGNSGYSIEELYGDTGKNVEDGAIQKSEETNEGKAHGASADINKLFDDFLKEKYNISCSIKRSDDVIDERVTGDNYLDIYNKINSGDNNKIILNTQGADLYDMNGNLVVEDIGGHAMYITGVTEDGKFIVSSWGNKYIVDLSGIKNTQDSWASFTIIDYE